MIFIVDLFFYLLRVVIWLDGTGFSVNSGAGSGVGGLGFEEGEGGGAWVFI